MLVGAALGATLGDEEGAALGEVEGRLVGTALGAYGERPGGQGRFR